MHLLFNILFSIGDFVLRAIEKIGIVVLFTIVSLSNIFRRPTYIRKTIKYFFEFTFFSLPIVALTALFAGMVLALQSYIGFSRFSAEGAVANVVVISITRELGPVLTALMVAGRISGSIAAEIGTMKVSEQLDALYTMSINPIKYLITPKIVACFFALPVLVLFADIIGVMGGWIVAVIQLDFNGVLYLKNTVSFVTFIDVFSGIVKAFVFGLIISSIGCYFGYFTKNGAIGVGKSTTNAVVLSSMLIFLFDYILTVIFFNL